MILSETRQFFNQFICWHEWCEDKYSLDKNHLYIYCNRCGKREKIDRNEIIQKFTLNHQTRYHTQYRSYFLVRDCEGLPQDKENEMIR